MADSTTNEKIIIKGKEYDLLSADAALIKTLQELTFSIERLVLEVGRR